MRFYIFPFELIFRNRKKSEKHNSRNNQKHMLVAQSCAAKKSLIWRLKLLFNNKTIGFTCVFLASICLFNQAGWATPAAGLPTGLCSTGHYHCDSKTLIRWNEFKNSIGIEDALNDFLSVGSCSANGRSDSRIQILLGLLDDVDQKYFGALINFNGSLEQYKNSDPSQIKHIFPNIKIEPNRLNLYSTHAYVEYTQMNPFRYWLRYQPSSGKVFMVAYFGYLNTFLCEFSPNTV